MIWVSGRNVNLLFLFFYYNFRPRLGPMLHRVVGVGVLYFILASVEGSLRVINPKNDPSSQALLASVPLAVLDAAICWWISFSYCYAI